MSELKTKPDIRFAGFADDWEQRELGAHAEILTGGTPTTFRVEYWEPKEIPWMSSGEVNKRRLDSTDDMISREGLDNSNARWIKEYSVLIALAGQGKTRGMVAINNMPLTTNQSIAAIVPDESLYYEFIFQNLLRRYDELRLASSGDGTRGGLNKKIISDVIISCPNIGEQKEIGSLFSAVDHLTTLQQREYDKTVNIKKAMLEKMFPKAGADRPEIRFAGFTAAWEQRKLGEIYKTYSGQTPFRGDQANFQNPTTPWIKTTDLNNREITFNEEDISEIAAEKLRILPIGTVLIAMYGGFNQIGRTGLLTYRSTINQALTALEPNKEVAPYFLITELNKRTNDWKKFAASSRTDPNITKIDIESFIFYYPLLEEQLKIGSFFANLDNLITLHQRELTKLKNMKKALLEKMFV